MSSIQDIIDEWFGALDELGRASEEKSARWFEKNPSFDQMLKDRFGPLVEDAIEGNLEDWADTNEGALALILLLDQFARNIHRGTPKMYAGDQHAVRISERLIDEGRDNAFPHAQRVFVYMPLMHSEDLVIQNKCVECFEELVKTSAAELEPSLARNLKYAIAHRDIVAKWGRFPHRNAILDRISTPEEAEFLKQPGSSF